VTPPLCILKTCPFHLISSPPNHLSRPLSLKPLIVFVVWFFLLYCTPALPHCKYSRILCFVDRASFYNFVNRTNFVHSFFLNMFSAFLYMFQGTMCPSSGEYRTYATSGICHSTQITIWYAGRNDTVSFQPAYQTVIYIE